MQAHILLTALFSGVSLAYPGVNTRDLKHDTIDNCTTNSQALTTWRTDTYILKVIDGDKGGTNGTFGFKSYNSAINMTVDCALQDGDLAKLKGSWSKCNDTKTEFKFDLGTMDVSVKESWTCPGSPGVVFSANATGKTMMMGCRDSTTEKGVVSDCNLMETDLMATVTSVAQV